MATLKNTKPKEGMTLHHWVATGGKPKDFKKAAPNAVSKPSK